MKFWISAIISMILVQIGVHFQNAGHEFIAAFFNVALPFNIMYSIGLSEGNKSV